MARIIVHTPGGDGTMRMIVVKDAALLTTPAGRGRGTARRMQTVSTPGGPGVATICVSTPSISPRPSIQTTPPGLGTLPVTTAATECATRITTGAGTMLRGACQMKTARTDITARQTWISPHAMSWMSVTLTIFTSMAQPTVERRLTAPTLWAPSPALVTLDSSHTRPGQAAETRMSAQRGAAHAGPTLTAGISMGLITARARLNKYQMLLTKNVFSSYYRSDSLETPSQTVLTLMNVPFLILTHAAEE